MCIFEGGDIKGSHLSKIVLTMKLLEARKLEKLEYNLPNLELQEFLISDA